jgi:hypothetical protein
MADVPFPSRPAIGGAQLGALRQLLRSILPANQFYARKLGEAGLNGEFANLEEFMRRCPFTTKEEIEWHHRHAAALA